MRSRCMSLLPRTTLHSDSEHLLLHVHAACPCCLYSICCVSILHVQVPCQVCRPRLHVHALCPWCSSKPCQCCKSIAPCCCFSMTHAYAACPCLMSPSCTFIMLRAHTHTLYLSADDSTAQGCYNNTKSPFFKLMISLTHLLALIIFSLKH
jgi:hypothetical protein